MESLLDMIATLEWWETSAVILGVIYLLLAARENIWCWPAGFLSTLIFMFLFWDATLVMQSGLQFYYLGMAVYGWWNWKGNKTRQQTAVSEFSRIDHIRALLLICLATAVSSVLLGSYGDSAMPLLDSLTTWGSVVATWMVARKIIDNWLYWIVIDILAAYLYFDRGLVLTTVLYLAYSAIAIAGYLEWKKKLPPKYV